MPKYPDAVKLMGTKVKCKFCGKKFKWEYNPNMLEKRYCSPLCRKYWNSLNSLKNKQERMMKINSEL